MLPDADGKMARLAPILGGRGRELDRGSLGLSRHKRCPNPVDFNVGVAKDADEETLKRELLECRAPSAEVAAIPLRMILWAIAAATRGTDIRWIGSPGGKS